MRTREAFCLIGALLIGGGPSAAPRAQGTAVPISGLWVGAFQSYPHFVQMSLQVPASTSGSPVAGELRLEPLVEGRSVGRGPTGVVAVTIDYQPVARTIVITPAADASRAIGARVPTFSGVMDAEKQLFGGVVVNAPGDASPYFVLGRKESAQAFLDTLRDAMAPAGGRSTSRSALRGLRGLGGGGPGSGKLGEWASRLTSEYPDIDPYRTEMGKLLTMARPLFRDDHFRAFFGKPFDELERSELERIAADIRKIPPPRSNFPEERANGAVLAVGRGFSPSGTSGAPDITLSVIAFRPIQAWRAQTTRLLETGGASTSVLSVITAIEAADAQLIGSAWPSERQNFVKLVAASRGRVSGPALALKVDELLAGATTFEAVPKLAAAIESVPTVSMAAEPTRKPEARGAAARARRTVANPSGAPPAPDSIAALMELATPETRQAQRSRMETRLTELVDAETARDRAALSGLGKGLEGLQAGGRWLTEVSTKYQPVSSHASVRALFAQLATARSPLLRDAEPALAARIKAARSTSDIEQLRSAYLSVPSDRSDPAGGRLFQAAGTLESELRKTEDATAQKEAEAQREAASACASLSDKNGEDDLPGEPTERQMCRAVERVLIGAQEGMKDMQQECRGLNANSNPLAALTCLMGSASQAGGGPQASIRGFRKVACSPAAAAGRPGFFCDYVVGLASSNPMTASFVNRFSGGEVSTARFVKSSGTWIFLPPK